MEAIEANAHDKPNAEQAACCSPAAASSGKRWWWIGGAALVVGLAMYAGWDWLAATGLATVIVALAPCLVMCALGLCMRHGKEKGPSSLAEIRKTYEPPSRG